MLDTDILITGAGSAGLTLALLLAKNCPDLPITVLEQGPAPVAGPAQLNRVSALNLASQRVLDSLGVWQLLTAKPAYQQMQVWEADSFARIEFATTDLGALAQTPALGWIVDNEELRACLYQRALQYPNIQWKFDARIQQISASERQNLLTLADGSAYISKLLVGADGANSMVREQLKMPLAFWDYDHHGLVAVVRTSEPHQATARQVFLPTGPLALLPLVDPHLVSIVWSVAPERAAELIAMPADQFNQALTAASQSVLGVLNVQTERRSYPLKMRYASQWQKHNAVLVADAAHTIHPLAGQGMNLGLMDACALAELIVQNISTGRTCNEQRMLRQYERWRKAEAQQMIALMEAFKRGFMLQHPLAKLVRAVGMAATNQLAPVKRQLLAAALGNQGDLPAVARPGVISL
ncbi:FAD-dependent monooxygenase [Rheinheimera texasensis]|uniref:FAD-dependent monooxygenase n=1 Tax=Rheinheimera texasensis TaxID=306205 RepID=UPI0004E0E64B|nr:FAD-dependent monooxygenase [Rheinheimera texasensis]